MLVTQSALLGYVHPNLRAVYVDTDEDTVSVNFYYDGPITEANEEAVECTLTEIISDYPPNKLDQIQFNYGPHRIDAPTPPPSKGHCVYFRYEE